MIKIVAADYVNDHEIRLRFSDDSIKERSTSVRSLMLAPL